MTNSQQSRRNFLNSVAILSAGTVMGAAIKKYPFSDTANDLQKNWAAFWKKSGGKLFYSSTDLNSGSNNKVTKGHYYEYGSVIYFPVENILAQPTWIYWQNDCSVPADAVVTLFNNTDSFNKIASFNRYEMDALYRISKEHGSEHLLLTSLNTKQPVEGGLTGIVKTNTHIKKNVQIQHISYYKGQMLVFEKKIIHHV